MSGSQENFDRLVQEAWSQEISGWDWRYLDGRLEQEIESWRYPRLVRKRMQGAGSLLEIGTGGGELFASLAPFPPLTVATEAYPPSVGLAGRRLNPLGIQVVQTEMEVRHALPFADGSFDLVVNRHAGYSPVEIHRLLKPGGRFLTQQVGGRNQFGLNELLQEEPDFVYSDWTLDYAVQELQDAGFRVLDAREAFPRARFYDIGAVVFYLKVIDWQVPGFDPQQHREKLLRIDRIIQDQGCLLTSEHRFIIEAQTPE